MFNCFKKILTGGVSHNKQSLNSCFCSLITAFVLVSGAINIARADVCFLPDSKGCEMVPYEEYGRTPTYPKDCFATKEEAMNARTAEVDSYYQNGDMWCIKSSCSGYNVTSMMPGGWSCLNCNDANSLNYNKYKCDCYLKDATPRSGYTIDLERCEEKPNACPSYASTDCVPDECHECNSINSLNPVYSGEKECLIYSTVDEHCPEGYVPDKPDTKCYSTQDMLCGEGKCYKAVDAPECGEGKRLVKANGVCSCECETGYHDDNGSCVKDDEQMYWCIYPNDFTRQAFGGGTRDGGVYNIKLEGDGVKEGGGNCSSGYFYVPYGVSVSIKYTSDIEDPYSHRGWMFAPLPDNEPVDGYIQGSYFTEDSFVATADVMKQDEKTMSPGDSIDLSPVISKADDIVIATRWIQECHGYYQLVHGKWQETFNSNLITTIYWPLTERWSNTVYLSATDKKDTVDVWNSIWQEAVKDAKLTGYSGQSLLFQTFESEFCDKLFEWPKDDPYHRFLFGHMVECKNTNECTYPLYEHGGVDCRRIDCRKACSEDKVEVRCWYVSPNLTDGFCTISDDSPCWGCYIGWNTQCIVLLEPMEIEYDHNVYDHTEIYFHDEFATADSHHAECYDNNGKRVTPEEILKVIGKADDEAVRYVTCDELGSKVIGHILPDK